jgi:Na+-translocating ferredoxin:NAD+ oxidoreductase RNF subunit RnfB
MTIILFTAAFAFVLALVLGTTLGFFREFFAVPHDPMIDLVREALPGANCGACGYPGCDNYASAIVSDNAEVTACTVGGSAVAEKISAITGRAGGSVVETVTILACQGSTIHTPLRGNYTGLQTCRGAKLSSGGTKLCSWGCLGYGDCIKVCKFGAISMKPNRLPVLDLDKCTGCRLCVAECPQGILLNVPKNQTGAITLCSNRNPVRQVVAKSCKIACIKCGACVRNCPQKCISLDTNIPVVDLSKCDSCGTCVEKCPTKVMKVLERDIIKTA